MYPMTQLATLRPDVAVGLEGYDEVSDEAGYVGDRILTPFEAAVAAGEFSVIPPSELLKNADTRRTNFSNYNRGDWQFTTDNFATKEHGFEQPVDHRSEKVYGSLFPVEVITADLTRGVVMRDHEKRAAGLIFNPTTFTGEALTTAVVNEWDDPEAADPITDVENAVQWVYRNTGIWPNAVVFNRCVFRKLRLVERIQVAIQSMGAGSATKARDITAAQLSAVFDLEVIVAGGVKNIANEGQEADLDEIWSSEYAMVCRVAKTNNLLEPCIGRTFHWSEDGSKIGGTIESYEDPARRATIIRCRHDVHQKIIEKKFGHLLSNITTTP